MSQDRSIVQRYADFAVSLRETPPSAEVRAHAVRVVLDWFAAALPGAGMEPATLAARALSDQVGAGAATLLGSGTPATGQAAAMINGTASHIVEFDDIYRDGLYHPGGDHRP